MSSKGHDFLVEMVQMKMKQMGYVILATDSNYKTILKNTPPTILNHRPDALGYNREKNSVCIGEAKYYGDLNTSRSHRQIEDYVTLTKDKKRNLLVIFGIPLSEGFRFLEILRKEGVELNERAILLTIPDRLIPKKENDDE